MLAASGPAGAVAIALDHMHRYEPQALRLLGRRPPRRRRGGRQGLARQPPGDVRDPGGDRARPAPATRADLDRLVWAPLNRPLRAWPEAAWFAASEAVDEFPVGPLPAELAAYDKLIPTVLTRTVQQIDRARPRRPDDLRRLPALLGQGRRRRRDRLRSGERPDARARPGTTPSGAPPGPTTTTRSSTVADLGDAHGRGRVARRARRPRRPAHAPHPDHAVRPRPRSGSTAARRPPATAPTARTSTAPTPISRTSSSTTG